MKSMTDAEIAAWGDWAPVNVGAASPIGLLVEQCGPVTVRVTYPDGTATEYQAPTSDSEPAA